jgi:hypothetical protein
MVQCNWKIWKVFSLVFISMGTDCDCIIHKLGTDFKKLEGEKVYQSIHLCLKFSSYKSFQFRIRMRKKGG